MRERASANSTPRALNTNHSRCRYSNGFDEELEEEDEGAAAAQEDTLQERPTSVAPPPESLAPPALSGRPWQVGGIVRVVDDGSAQGQLRDGALPGSVSASVRAAMAQLQVRVPPTFEHVPPAVLDTEILATVARKRVSNVPHDGGEAQQRTDDIV